MNRRDLLRIAPLAALAPVAVKIGNVEAEAHELKPGKKYIFVFDNHCTPEGMEVFAELMKERGIDAVAIIGDANVKIYELETNGSTRTS